MRKLFSASEIAGMRLPGLPTSKGAIIARAASENWPFETRVGRGGTRRVYEVPERYLAEPDTGAPARSGLRVHERLAPYGEPPDGSATPGQATGQHPAPTHAAMAGATVADPQLLTFAIRAFEEWAAARQLVITPERKAAIIALLYDYLVRGAGEKEVETFLQVLA